MLRKASEIEFEKYPKSTNICDLGNELRVSSLFQLKFFHRSHDVDFARHMDELKSSSSVLGRKIPDLEVLDSKLESALKSLLTADFKRARLRGRAKVRPAQSVLERNTNRNDLWWVQDHRNRRISFWHQRPTQSLVEERQGARLRHQWDEVPLSMTKVPEEEMLKILTNTALRLRGIEPSRDIVPPGRRRREENRPLMLDWNGSFACVKQGTKKIQCPQRRQVSSRDCRSQWKSQRRIWKKGNGEDASKARHLRACAHCTSKGRCSRGDSCSFWHDCDKKEKGKELYPVLFPQKREGTPKDDWERRDHSERTQRYQFVSGVKQAGMPPWKKGAMPQRIRMRSGAPTRMLPQQILWWLQVGEKWVM